MASARLAAEAVRLPPLPDRLLANVRGGGESGRQWLRALPATVDAVARRWNLRCLAPLPNLSFNYLMKGRRGPEPVVVKIVSQRQALAGEVAWLRAQQGRGAVRLHDVCETANAYLMAEVAPGQPATMLRERQATERIAAAIAALGGRRAPREGIVRVATWFDELRGFAEQPPAGIDAADIRAARAVAAELAVPEQDERLLHGDLHHDNLLCAGASAGAWRVIDPKGVVGDPAHDCAAMLRNGLDGAAASEIVRTIRSRLDILAAAAGFDAPRIAGWGYAQTVLSCCWSAAAGERAIHRELAVAAALRTLLH